MNSPNARETGLLPEDLNRGNGETPEEPRSLTPKKKVDRRPTLGTTVAPGTDFNRTFTNQTQSRRAPLASPRLTEGPAAPEPPRPPVALARPTGDLARLTPILSEAFSADRLYRHGPSSLCARPRLGFRSLLPEFLRVLSDVRPRFVGLVSGLAFLGFLIGLLVARSLGSCPGSEGPGADRLSWRATGRNRAIVALARACPCSPRGSYCRRAPAQGSPRNPPFNDRGAPNAGRRRRTRPAAFRAPVSTPATGVGEMVGGRSSPHSAPALTGLSWRACLGVLRGAGGATSRPTYAQGRAGLAAGSARPPAVSHGPTWRGPFP